MSISATLPAVIDQNPLKPGPNAASRAGSRMGTGTGRVPRGLGTPLVQFGAASFAVDANTQRQAELFYLQKQIHAQTPMVIVLEDGERRPWCIRARSSTCTKWAKAAKGSFLSTDSQLNAGP
jgi:hypothetical protein